HAQPLPQVVAVVQPGKTLGGPAEAVERRQGHVLLVGGPARDAVQPAARERHQAGEVALPQGLGGGGVPRAEQGDPGGDGGVVGHVDSPVAEREEILLPAVSARQGPGAGRLRQAGGTRRPPARPLAAAGPSPAAKRGQKGATQFFATAASAREPSAARARPWPRSWPADGWSSCRRPFTPAPAGPTPGRPVPRCRPAPPLPCRACLQLLPPRCA